MKKLVILLTLFFIVNISYSKNILSEYRTIKRDLHTVNEISNNNIIINIFISFIVILIILSALSIRKNKKNKEKLKLDILKYIEEKKLYMINNKLSLIEFTEIELNINKYNNLNDLKNKIELIIQSEIKIKERYDYIMKKYISDIDKANIIYNKQIFIGMTSEELIDSIGKPNKIEKEILKTKNKISFIYGNKSSGDIYIFENDKLARYKDR